jgi:hypothetical protein
MNTNTYHVYYIQHGNFIIDVSNLRSNRRSMTSSARRKRATKSLYPSWTAVPLDAPEADEIFDEVDRRKTRSSSKVVLI